MNKVQIKKLFWKIANAIDGCSDIVIKNNDGIITEKGMQLSNGYSVMLGVDDGIIRIYNESGFPLIAFTEENEVLIPLVELLEILKGE